MAIYRADQAIVTFGTEAAQGGVPEGASAVTDGSGDTLINMSSGAAAGLRSITVDSTSGITAGEFIQIGPDIESETNIYRNAEIRRVEFVEGTTDGKLHLDPPTAFFHVDNSKVQVVTATTDTDDDKIMTFIPGVYETVDVPDPEMAIEPRYLLGTSSNRNYYTQYKSSQSYNGSIGSFILLNGWPLRFPMGKVTSIPVGGTITSRTDLNGDHKKGDMWINVDSATNLAAGDLITIDYAATPTRTDVCEVRRLVAVSGTTRFKLNYPLQFDHPALTSSTQIREITSPTYYLHDIWETIDLDSISWNVLLRDSAGTTANDFIRRYYGGKVGGASLSASEEGMLTMSWDGITFMGMNHNQADHTNLSEEYQASQAMPGFGLMQTIDDADMTGAIATTASSYALRDRAYPQTNPYFFSQGTISMFNTSIEFARIRDFNISIDNSIEPKYYLNTRHGKLNRGPSETREGNRSYSMSATIALPDSTAATADTQTLFKELLLEGDYGTTASPSNKGFAIDLVFTRGTNDSITISIPADGVANAGGNGSGAFINSATHNVGGGGALEVDANMMFRNMKIQIKDSVPLYP